MTKENLTAMCLRLPAKDRANLARDLLHSLDDAAERDAERLWFEEAARRYEEYRTGKVKGLSVAAVFKRLKARFR